MLAAGPLVGCADASPDSSLPGGAGGSEPQPAGGAGGTGGSPSTSGGSSFISAGRFGDTGGGVASGGSSGGPGAAGTSAAAGPGMVVGNVSSIPPGSLSIVGGIFLLGRDAEGLYAMSMQCTHKGCTVTLAGDQLACTCHESRFDSNGEVLQGPAQTQLPHFTVFVDAAGNISVDRFTVVSGDARTAV